MANAYEWIREWYYKQVKTTVTVSIARTVGFCMEMRKIRKEMKTGSNVTCVIIGTMMAVRRNVVSSMMRILPAKGVYRCCQPAFGDSAVCL